jgi:hypothetical protein
MLVGGTFCDFEKAFDCVSHEVLRNKLRYYGIKYKQYNLYKSYLQDRFQRTTICNGWNNSKVYSGWTKVTNGVPQRSILGRHIAQNNTTCLDKTQHTKLHKQ